MTRQEQNALTHYFYDDNQQYSVKDIIDLERHSIDL